MKLPVKMTINGQTQSHEVEPRLLLVHYIRETVGLTGTHIGCDTSQCGACTILMNGQAIKSCTLFAAQADGAKITTIEGLADPVSGKLHPVQQGVGQSLRPVFGKGGKVGHLHVAAAGVDFEQWRALSIAALKLDFPPAPPLPAF